ncbi:MAG TPA: alpha/beta fold hydrolase [Burkholderiaceae bacterium]|jgi:pimeloyl-ACP methyl ester carboxylesterase|nr:alpha/beta fold hydrolase [Burkholderiaceae bacterium]
MPLLDRDGVRIHYEVHGKGPVVLLSHGYSATSQMWRGQIDALSKDHTLVVWDMRGHGLSDSPPEQARYSAEATVDDMAALLDVVGAERAVIGGLSLGGYMSLMFHARYPQRVRALLILDTGPGFRKDEARNGWNEQAARTAERFETEGVTKLNTTREASTGGTHRSGAGLAMAARGMLAQRDATVIESLPGIRVPSLILVGADDTPFLQSAEVMAAKIAGSQKVIIPAAGHTANIDQPQAFNEAVLAFLKTLPA